MSEFLPVRAFNRSQNVRIESKKIKSTSTTYIDISKTATHKEFSYHSAIGAVYVRGPVSESMTITQYGLGVTPKEGEAKKVIVEAGELRIRGTSTPVVVAKKELEVEKTTTKPRTDNVVVKLSTGVASIQKGTAAEPAVAPAVEEGYVVIATIALPKEKEEVEQKYITSTRFYL